MLGLTRKHSPQLFILSGNPYRAGIEVAFTHHNTTGGNQRGGGDTKLFGTQHSSNCQVAPGPDLTIGLYRYPAA